MKYLKILQIVWSDCCLDVYASCDNLIIKSSVFVSFWNNYDIVVEALLSCVLNPISTIFILIIILVCTHLVSEIVKYHSAVANKPYCKTMKPSVWNLLEKLKRIPWRMLKFRINIWRSVLGCLTFFVFQWLHCFCKRQVSNVYNCLFEVFIRKYEHCPH